MKTSRQERVDEYEMLKWRSSQGRFADKADVLRYIDLRDEFEPTPRQNVLKPAKSTDLQ